MFNLFDELNVKLSFICIYISFLWCMRIDITQTYVESVYAYISVVEVAALTSVVERYVN